MSQGDLVGLEDALAVVVEEERDHHDGGQPAGLDDSVAEKAHFRSHDTIPPERQ
jgi:hypothetical protein